MFKIQKKIFLFLFLINFWINFVFSWNLNFFDVQKSIYETLKYNNSYNMNYSSCVNWNVLNSFWKFNLVNQNWKINFNWTKCYESNTDHFNWKFLYKDWEFIYDNFEFWTYNLWASKNNYSFINSFYLFNPKKWSTNIYIKSLLNIDRTMQKFFNIDWLKNYLNKIKKDFNVDPKYLWYMVLVNSKDSNNIYNFNNDVDDYIKNHKKDILKLKNSSSISIDWTNVYIIPFMKNPYNWISDDIKYYWIINWTKQ